jgi:ribulose-5-phosphate 4-epimerase/fuculose-1-phosphate aldolase
MKTYKIKEVQDYFKAKLLAGEFELIKCTNATISVKVDEHYTFFIWAENNVRNRELSGLDKSFIDLSFTDNEKQRLDEVIKPIHQKYLREVLIAVKEAELEQLKKLQS